MRQIPSIVTLCLISSTLSLSGCTLARLWDFDPPECVSSEQCDAANGNVDDPCVEWACLDSNGDGTRECVNVDRQEVCDGSDNDCDGIVDEAQDGIPVLSADRVESVTVNNLGSSFELAATPRIGVNGGALLAFSSSQIETTAFRIEADGEPDSNPRTLSFVTHDAPDNLSPFVERAGCWRPPVEGDVTAFTAACSIRDPALSAGGASPFIASIDGNGCQAGLLRVGVTNVDNGEVSVVGPYTRSNSFAGVNPDPTDPNPTPCSVHPGTACMEALAGSGEVRTACGASGPAIAGGTVLFLDETGAQESPSEAEGLVAWIGRSNEAEPACDGLEAPVLLAGLRYRSTVRANDTGIPDFVELANEGTPSVLGDTSASDSVAATTWVDEVSDGVESAVGFFVGYPTGDTSIDVWYLPAQGAVAPPNDGFFPDDTAGSANRTGREIPPLEGLVRVGTFPGLGGKIDGLQLSAADYADGVLRVGMTWREMLDEEADTCASADTQLVFQMLRIEATVSDDTAPCNTEEFPGCTPRLLRREFTLDATKASTTPATRVARNDSRKLGRPVISYQPSGFAVPEVFTRGGVVASGEGEAGGFVVAFVDGPLGAFARRVSVMDGQVLSGENCNASTECPSRALALGENVSQLVLWRDRERVYYGYRSQQSVETGAIRCGE